MICYLPGTLALGVKNGMPEKHMRLAEQLLETCYRMYADQPTGLAPEISYFNYEEVRRLFQAEKQKLMFEVQDVNGSQRCNHSNT